MPGVLQYNLATEQQQCLTMHMPVFKIKTGRDMETGSRGARRGPDGGFYLLGIILYCWSLLH